MPPLDKKQTVATLKLKKKRGEKITCVTAYDYPTAKVASDAGIDLLLVGDSLGMVLQGHRNTLKVTMDEMVYHTRMVSAAQPLSMVVGDMPFGSFHVTIPQTVENAIRFIREGRAEAVKLEGGRKRLPIIEAILNAEIPVLGHLGLTPQSVHQLGGFKLQGKLREKADEIYEDALLLEKAGVFAIVLESIPAELAKRISESLKIPTIGIGAGKFCDGQILVFHDLMGFTDSYLPKFVRRYAHIYDTMRQALQDYREDVQNGAFPGPAETVFLDDSPESEDK